MTQEIDVQLVLDTLVKRIAQLELDKAVLTAQLATRIRNEEIRKEAE